MKLRSLLFALLGCALALSAVAIEKLVVGASSVPHAEILAFVKPRLASEGIELQIKVFTDYVQPNVQLVERHLDANFFQHRPFLDAFNRGKGQHLVTLVAVHLEPFGAYSSKHRSLAALPRGALVALPNDPSNSGRALRLLQQAGLLQLTPSAGIEATAHDIAENPRQLKFRELEAATLPRILDQVDLALINTNYALEAKLNPVRDALALEDGHSPYANFLVTRPDHASSPALAKLAAALTSPEVKHFLAERYRGAVLPAF